VTTLASVSGRETWNLGASASIPDLTLCPKHNLCSAGVLSLRDQIQICLGWSDGTQLNSPASATLLPLLVPWSDG
jgi:hypothetical protein